MKKQMTGAGLAMMMTVAAVMPVAFGGGGDAWAADPGQSPASADSMTRLRIILQKLQDAMASMKDLDKLEESGMPKKQVDRMRRAMQLKINQMMEEAIKNIHAL